jgi:hypothetical protein
LLRDPGLGAQEDRPLGLLLGNQHAAEADVVHDHAVRQVGHVERDAVLKAVALDAQAGRDRAAGSDRNLGGGVGKATGPSRVG